MFLVIVFIREKIRFSLRYKMKYFEKEISLACVVLGRISSYLKIARNIFIF